MNKPTINDFKGSKIGLSHHGNKVKPGRWFLEIVSWWIKHVAKIGAKPC